MAEQAEPREERKKKGQISGLQVMFATLLAISLILAINFTSRIAANQPLQEALDRVQAEIVDLRVEQLELSEQQGYVQSDAYVEAWARSDGRMVRPSEILIVPMTSDSTTSTQPVDENPETFNPIETTPPQPDPWQLWWALFFDSPPPDF
jgi:cell division protein FtsB